MLRPGPVGDEGGGTVEVRLALVMADGRLGVFKGAVVNRADGLPTVSKWMSVAPQRFLADNRNDLPSARVAGG
jgi:hypothetical protein